MGWFGEKLKRMLSRKKVRFDESSTTEAQAEQNITFKDSDGPKYSDIHHHKRREEGGPLPVVLFVVS